MTGAAPLPRHFLDLWRMDAGVLRLILEDAKARKAARRGWPRGRVDADAPGAGRTLAMVFQKNSTRTNSHSTRRSASCWAVTASSPPGPTCRLDRGETIEDTARVLSRMVDAVMIRAVSHADIENFAAAATVPVINGLTDRSHPCQIMADLMTFEEHRGPVEGRTFAWVGDGNNVCASFIHAAAKFGFRLVVAGPQRYWPREDDLARAPGLIEISEDMHSRARGRLRDRRRLGVDGRRRL